MHGNVFPLLKMRLRGGAVDARPEGLRSGHTSSKSITSIDTGSPAKARLGLSTTPAAAPGGTHAERGRICRGLEIRDLDHLVVASCTALATPAARDGIPRTRASARMPCAHCPLGRARAAAIPAASVRKPRRDGVAASDDAEHKATAPALRRPERAAGIAGAVKARHAPTPPAMKRIDRCMS